MSLGPELSRLFHRDLTRLAQQIRATPPELLWSTLPGIGNSAGNLALHIEGNLREFVGRQLGGVEYVRQRDREFDSTGIGQEELAVRLEDTRTLVVPILESLPDTDWDAVFPQQTLGVALTTRQYVLHLYGHLNYHLGQADYLRRALTGEGALRLAGL